MIKRGPRWGPGPWPNSSYTLYISDSEPDKLGSVTCAIGIRNKGLQGCHIPLTKSPSVCRYSGCPLTHLCSIDYPPTLKICDPSLPQLTEALCATKAHVGLAFYPCLPREKKIVPQIKDDWQNLKMYTNSSRIFSLIFFVFQILIARVFEGCRVFENVL